MDMLDFRNFEPDAYLQQYANSMLFRMREVAPYGSTTTGWAEKSDDEYMVTVEIRSPYGIFVSTGDNDDPRIAIDRAESHLYEQLARWRKFRFEREFKEQGNAA